MRGLDLAHCIACHQASATLVLLGFCPWCIGTTITHPERTEH